MSDLYSIVLAAGKGTRMKSTLPKVLHKVGGKPMIGHVIDVLQEINTQEIVVIVGHESEKVKEYVGGNALFAEQLEQLGTAHAVSQASPILSNKSGTTLVICGDTPLFTKETLSALIEKHHNKNAAATILTTELSSPTGYGRIIRDDKGNVLKIVEEKDASLEEKEIKEVNSGTYCFDNQKLFAALSKVNNNNKQGEYYLTDVIEILKTSGEIVTAYKTDNHLETIGVNDRIALAKAEKIMRNRVIEKHMREGVTIIDPDNTYIEKDVQIAPDTIIYPGTYLRGKTVIGSNCEIGPNTELTNVEVASNVSITYSVVISSNIEENAKIGPFAFIRPGSHIGASVKVGDFVEIKNSKLGKGTKVSHLSYIGDADLGEDINIGCGTITVNYDGFSKHRTIIEDRSFIGCNTNLIAPVSVGKDAYVAAGSTITDDVPDFSLAIARERQTNKKDYVKKIKEKKQINSNK
ncbi:UDP-N-acetylglucosamine diphosphorylase/glucosamine-1-phosphate N-acetyltransferase [Vulcanibacillus modesticaldus]|uniref:Bifunctional protein GlmU n=1 Tax=Vulcanibacillus modesticaldus TaxID=337097 RepID=A0A1D2YXB7_9BACI|nr:bifunctional UDP-N-acetylglucosamine diphosphorylase/glucosamine-1-phosphate N-acetyltransferase GlmU [Vulcanibacillus modesticaldus]OEG00290.1 UDP-N-acetylglucosamine diphosphorylase/glucosamine-1-phosphate N-acetyltransferase [Vulcanibacillus modesticaldus]